MLIAERQENILHIYQVLLLYLPLLYIIYL